MKLLAFGEVLWDVYPDQAYIGGAPLNFAAHAAKHGWEAYLLSAVGDDVLGQKTRDTVQAMGVRTAYLSTADKPTGSCVVTLNESGVPSYDLKNDVAWDAIDSTGAQNIPFDVLYYGTLALRGEDNRTSLNRLLKNGAFRDVFADINIRPPFYSAAVLTFVLANATIVKISDEELPIVLSLLDLQNGSAEDSAQRIADRFQNIRILIITKGGDGSLAYDTQAGRFVYADVVKTEVVSTVGAGDSFSAAFLCRYFTCHNIEDSLAYASKIAAFVVSHTEAVPEYEVK